MSDDAREAIRELGRIRALPYTTSRTVAAEQTARRIEADGPKEVLAYALFTLVESYVWGGEPAKAFVTFGKATRLWDQSPELFDDTDRGNYFWAFKWMVGHLADYPEVPASQIEQSLADMTHRYAVAGNGYSAIAYERYRWARHRGTPDEAELMSAWITTPRDSFSQCEACSLGEEADYHRRNGHLVRAVELVEGAPETTQWCATEPAGMELVAAMAHLELGHPREALAAYQRSVGALQKSMSDMADTRGLRFEFLARAGEAERALKALRDDAGLLRKADTPYSRLRFLLPVLAGLSSLPAEHPVKLSGFDATDVGQLRDWVRGSALELALAFDRRNATDHYQKLVEAALATTGVATRLDFAVLPTPAAAGGSSVRVEAPPAEADDLPQLLVRAEQLAEQGELRAAASTYQAAADLADAKGELIDSGFAHAEAARCAAEFGDEVGADQAYTHSLARLRAAGVAAVDRVPVIRAWAPLAVDLGRSEAAVAELRLALSELFPGEGAPALSETASNTERTSVRAWADTADLLARTIASGSDQNTAEWAEATALADAAARAFAQLGSIGDASHAFWLAGRLQRSSGEVASAQWSFESAFEGFGMTRTTEARAEVGSDLIDVLRATGQEQQAEAVARSLAEG